MAKKSKIIKLDKKEVKKLQREKFLEKRRAANNPQKELKDWFKFSKKDIIVLIVIGIGILLYYFINNYHKYGVVFNKRIDSTDVTVIDMISTDNVILGYKDSIIVFENGYLTSYNDSGNKEWQKKLEEIYTPEICVCGNFIQITNKDTGYIYILEGQYETGRIKIEGEILSANVNDEGTSVVEYSTSGLKTVIGVYNEKGKELYGLKLDNNTVSDYSLSSNSRYLAYSYADISGISLVTKIAVIDLKELRRADYKFQDIVNKNNELVYKMYWNGNNLNVMLNNSIIKYNASSNKLKEYSISNLNASNLDICGGKLAYITAGTNYVIYVDKYNGRNIGNVEIQDAPKHFIYENDLIYVCYQKEMYVYNKWGILVKQYTSDTTITKPIIFDSGKKVAFNISNKIIIFKI